jgi:hypothetical protein
MDYPMTAPIAPLETPNDDDWETVATRRIWRWVVIQAVLEASKQGMPDVDVRWKDHAAHAAIIWLTTDTSDLREVCDNAGLDYRAVLEGARRKYGQPTQEN